MLYMRADARSDADVLDATRARFPALSRQPQRVARFLVDHSGDAVLAAAAVRATEAQLYDLGAYLPQKKGARP